MENTNLPTLAELHHAPEVAFKNDQLNLLLNQEVPKKWIKYHPTATMKNERGEVVPLPYIPIDKIEFLLTRIFQEWEVKIVREGQLFQSVYVTVRLKVKNPITGKWKKQFGIGSCPVQTDRGKSAADLGAIKSNAVQLALPAAESYAIKDAAEKFGRLFGKDIARLGTLSFTGSYMDANNIKEPVGKVVPNEDEDTAGKDKASTIKAIKTKADLVRAYGTGLLSASKYNELLSGFTNGVQMP